jgi:hypothetical protein
MLHNQKDTFEQLVLRTSEYLGAKAEIVEKDYFVTLFLKRIAAVRPDIVSRAEHHYPSATISSSDFPRILT